MMAEESPVGICILHGKKIVYANPTFIDICGRQFNEIYATPFIKYVYKADKNKIEKLFNNRFDKKLEEVRIVNNNDIQWVEFTSKVIKYKDKDSLLITVLDITEKKKSEEKIKYLSYHDKLTDLYNRNYFEEEIKRLDTKRQLPLSNYYGGCKWFETG